MASIIANHGFSFEIEKNVTGRDTYAAMSEEEIFTKLERSRNREKEGRFRDVNAVISDMRAKYGI